MKAEKITVDLAEAISLKFFGKSVSAKLLPGEVDLNFKVTDDTSKEVFLLKISREDLSEDLVDLQCKALEYLQNTKFPLNISDIISSKVGSHYTRVLESHIARLHKWVDGEMLSGVVHRNRVLLHKWGQTCGLLSKHLEGFDHHAAHRSYKWNPSEVLDTKKYFQYFKSDQEQQIAAKVCNLFEVNVQPLLGKLRKSVNYNDAHEHNLLIDGNYPSPEIIGIIDFGDIVYTETINELAIACAYASMYMPDPIEAAARVVEGYHEIFPLKEDELKVLFTLMCCRLLISVSNAAWNKYKEPDNEYLLISEKPAWDLLNKLSKISPEYANYSFRNACNLEPCPKYAHYIGWINQCESEIHPVINFKDKNVTFLDFSVGSADLGNNSKFDTIDSFNTTVSRIIEDRGAEIGIGGYGETRPFYSTDSYKVEGNEGASWRTVHLGVDVWADAGTEISCPIDGVIHSFQNNACDCDYGPTIIIQHKTEDGLLFYTLYGHLSLDSLDRIEPGAKVIRGEKFAKIGSPPINGNWPPHLHFQVILDLIGNNGDFPGVTFAEKSSIWKSICPEGYNFFGYKLPLEKDKLRMEISQILAKRNKHLGKNLSVSYERPLHMIRGYRQFLYDTTGRRYLDTVNNVSHVGHEHPRVVKKAQDQLALLNTNTRYLHENIVLFAEELLKKFPPELCVVYFVNSGSEANELALRMVSTVTGSKETIAVESGYHGNTSGCVDISSYKFDGKGGTGAPGSTHIIPLPDVYRGIHKDLSSAGYEYSNYVAGAINKIQESGKNLGGFICESIISCGGQIVLPKGYLASAYQYVKQSGGLCIADEVQVGIGRVGSFFWGFELQDVVPDIVTIGKPLGNGHPLAAVVTTKEVSEAFSNGMEYFNTFGGNPVSCAIGREVLKVVEEEGLQSNASLVGDFLIKELKYLKDTYPLIGDVRGHGLFLGIELIKDECQNPAPDYANYIVNRMRERGILMSLDGPLYNVLKIKPPMCFTNNDAEFLLENLEKVLKENYLLKRG